MNRGSNSKLGRIATGLAVGVILSGMSLAPCAGAQSKTGNNAAIRSFDSWTQVRTAWNRAAADVQPYATVSGFQQDNAGDMFAQVGSHVFLTGFLTSDGYALDLLLDRPLTNIRMATEQLLPYWQILIRATQPSLSLEQADTIVRNLGVFHASRQVPDRFAIDAVTTHSHGIQYALSYTDGLVLSAEVGTQATNPSRDLDGEIKQTSLLAGDTVPVILSRYYIDSHIGQGLPPRLSTAILHGAKGSLTTELKRIANWTVDITSLSTESVPGAQPVLAEAGVQDIEHAMEAYDSPGFIQHLLHDEQWANWVRGTVSHGALVESAHTEYAHGRIFAVEEPPFQDGEQFEFLMPLPNDVTNYALEFLRKFGEAPLSAIRNVSVLPNRITVTLKNPGQASGMPQVGTYTFHLAREHGHTVISGIDVPPFEGP